MMKKDVFKECEYCGKTYRINTPTQKFCSKECSSNKLLEEKENKNLADYFIFERDNFTCCYCGKSSIEDRIKLVVEHIIPRYAGGNNSVFNVVTSCADCNSSKLSSILTKSVFYRLLRRNIKRNKGLSSNMRNEIKERLGKHFVVDTDFMSYVRIVDYFYPL